MATEGDSALADVSAVLQSLLDDVVVAAQVRSTQPAAQTVQPNCLSAGAAADENAQNKRK
eukprot:COSAG02_NODE_28813_length_582_cov_0.587992_1_plen_59_part_10